MRDGSAARRSLDPRRSAARFWLACAHHGSDASPSAAIEDAGRAIALYRDLGDRASMSLACSILAFSLLQTGRVKKAGEALNQGASVARSASPLLVEKLRREHRRADLHRAGRGLRGASLRG